MVAFGFTEIIMSVSLTPQEPAPAPRKPSFLTGATFFEGLSDAQIADVEAVALQRADLSRSGE